MVARFIANLIGAIADSPLIYCVGLPFGVDIYGQWMVGTGETVNGSQLAARPTGKINTNTGGEKNAEGKEDSLVSLSFRWW